ncbi:MAG: DUF4271 domain-containing protein [Prevotellaceae bacterium]|jgi:hypothetical protein|nr:DUF4271 domain-containing protein [Prevotellaceae bacterium]
MTLTSDYISVNRLHNTCCDAPFCACPDIDISTDTAPPATEMPNSKPELLHASLIAEMPPNVFVGNREAASWLISGLLLLYIVVLIFSKKNIILLRIALFSKQNKLISYHNFPRFFIRTINLFVIFSIFIISAFFYLIEKDAGISKTPLELFAVIATAVCLYCVLKILIIKIIGYISELKGLKNKLFSTEIIILSIYGLFSGFFLTLCAVNPFNRISIWLTVISVITILLYLFKISKIIMIFINEKISLFFLILYLCAIEILPAWLIIDFL